MALAPVQKTFAEIARITVVELKLDLLDGTGKKICVGYSYIIDNYFAPFFGEWPLKTSSTKTSRSLSVSQKANDLPFAEFSCSHAHHSPGRWTSWKNNWQGL